MKHSIPLIVWCVFAAGLLIVTNANAEPWWFTTATPEEQAEAEKRSFVITHHDTHVDITPVWKVERPTFEQAEISDPVKPLWLITYHENLIRGWGGQASLKRTIFTDKRPDVWLKDWRDAERERGWNPVVIDFCIRLQ